MSGRTREPVRQRVIRFGIPDRPIGSPLVSPPVPAVRPTRKDDAER